MKRPVPDIKNIFAKFAGRDIAMKEKLAPPKSPGKPPVLVSATPVKGYANVLKEMRDEARALGLKLFVLWPGHSLRHAPFAQPKKRDDRIIARVEKAPDGLWRVSKDFYIG
jgi:hypothetical protein